MAVTPGRTGNAETLTGVGTWDVLFDTNDPAITNCGAPPRVIWFLCPLAAVKLRITGIHEHTVGVPPTQYETVTADRYIERAALMGPMGLISKIECQPVTAGTPAVYWGVAVA